MDNTAAINAIKAKTDKLSFNADDDVKSTLDGEEVTTDDVSRTASKADVSNLDEPVSSRMAASDYTAPKNAEIDSIKLKTDRLNFTGNDVKSTLDGEEVTTDDESRTASKADVTDIEDQLGIHNELEMTSDGTHKYKVKEREDRTRVKREYDVDDEDEPKRVTPT